MSINDVLREVCNYYQISSKEVLSRSRKAPIVRARYVTYYLLFKGNIPKRDIALTFRRSPGDIKAAYVKFHESLPFNPQASREIEFLLNNLKGFILSPTELGLIFQKDFITGLIRKLYLDKPSKEDSLVQSFEQGKYYRNEQILKILINHQKSASNLLSRLYGTKL